jgi:hypothetical protein
MLLSVIAILLTLGASAVFQYLTWAQIRPSDFLTGVGSIIDHVQH